jgi:hypothetical protein
MKKQALYLIVLIFFLKHSAVAQVDWSEVGSNFSKVLNEEAARRSKMKLEIENYTTGKIDEIRNTQLNNGYYNLFIVNQFSKVQSSTISVMNNYYTSLKNGQIPVSNYRSGVESIKSNFNSYKNIANWMIEYLAKKPEETEKIKSLFNSSNAYYKYDKYIYFQLFVDVNNKQMTLNEWQGLFYQ